MKHIEKFSHAVIAAQDDVSGLRHGDRVKLTLSPKTIRARPGWKRYNGSIGRYWGPYKGSHVVRVVVTERHREVSDRYPDKFVGETEELFLHPEDFEKAR
jgi:ribosomal protein L21E